MGRRRKNYKGGGIAIHQKWMSGGQIHQRRMSGGQMQPLSGPLLGSTILIVIFTIIIPILASLKYQFPVKIMFGFYLLFLAAYGSALDSSQIPKDALGNPLENPDGTVIGNSFLNSLTNWGILCILIPGTLAILAATYKHYTMFLPVSFALIGAIVLLNSVDNNLYINILTFLFATAAAGTLIALAVQQSYVNTKGGTTKEDGETKK
jgi:hypothetical protein